MARTVTTTAVKRIITKGLTGWQAGKLILQDMVDSFMCRGSVLTETDMAAIQRARMTGVDVRDYKMFMALCEGFHMGYMLADWACKDACLQIDLLNSALEDAKKRRTVELFESFGPRIVTQKQYEDIVAAQRQRKLAFEFGLGHVIEERFYAIAPPEARTAIEESGFGTESVADFVGAVPEAYADLCKQAIDEIHRLHSGGQLPAVYDEADAQEVETLLVRWRDNGLSPEDAMRLIDKLFVTGQVLYDCSELPEWRPFIEEYQRHWFDEDDRFRHVYAVLDDCPKTWLDAKGHYRRPECPSEWITHSTELLLGLIGHDGKAGKSVKRVGVELRNRLHIAEQNIRMFQAVKAVLDTAADAVGLDLPHRSGFLAVSGTKLDAFIALYNFRLEELQEKRRAWQPEETRLEKALKMLPAIDLDRLKPTSDSLAQLKGKILDDARGDEWLRTKIRSVECGDGVNLGEPMR